MRDFGLVLTTVVAIIFGLCLSGTLETHYYKDAVVIEVNEDEVLVEDQTENIWAFSGEGYEVGQILRLTMDTNTTDNTIEDDEIVSVHTLKK